MNEIVNKFLLSRDKFMAEMNLRQPGLTYNAWGKFTKNKKIIQKFKETGDSRNIFQNELDKACFQHVTAYGDFKDLTRRTGSDKMLSDKAFNIAKIGNMMDTKGVLFQWFINLLIKDLLVVVLKIKNMSD